MISSKPEAFKEGPGAGERLQAWPSAELAEQFLQEWVGQGRLVRQGQFLLPARQLRALSGWQCGKRKTFVLSAGLFACLLLGARPARSPGYIPLSECAVGSWSCSHRKLEEHVQLWGL